MIITKGLQAVLLRLHKELWRTQTSKFGQISIRHTSTLSTDFLNIDSETLTSSYSLPKLMMLNTPAPAKLLWTESKYCFKTNALRTLISVVTSVEISNMDLCS